MISLANLGNSSGFVGMLADSRSVLSYTMHEHFRRILCNQIENWVEKGESTVYMEILEMTVKGISFNNAKDYFNRSWRKAFLNQNGYVGSQKSAGGSMKKFDFIPDGIDECSVTAWLHAEHDTGEVLYPGIIICPGGGYNHVSSREAEPVASPYFEAGYNTFIVTYSVGEKAKDFTPLCQLAATMVHVREHAQEWNTDPQKIAVCGFSAGGHLAASLGTLYKEPEFLEEFNRRIKSSEHYRKSMIRPVAMILSYPVITADEYAHEGSIKKVSGGEVGSEKYTWFGLDQHVDSQTPPAYIWHTAADNCVPVENSLKLCLALSAAKVPFEYHVFPEGGHGMSVCTEEVGTPCDYNARWMEWSIKWLDKTLGVRGK